MKKLLATSVVAIMAVLSTGARAESTAEGHGDAKAKLATGVSVTQKQEMDFKTLTRTSVDVAGEVVLAADTGVITTPTGVSSSGTGDSGVMTISGAPNTEIATIEYEDAVLNDGNGNELTVSIQGPASTTLAADGKADIKLGGTLTLNGQEPDGDYTTANGTSYKVTVTY